MNTKQQIPAIPLEFLKRFTFVTGEGDYAEKQVCIMSAAKLAVEIAEGEYSLKEALAGSIDADDYLDCVDSQLRELLIDANDSAFTSAAARKKWALATLPRIIGTKGWVHELYHKVCLQLGRNHARKFAETGKEEHFLLAQGLVDEGEIQKEDLLEAVEIALTLIEEAKAKTRFQSL